MSVTRAIEVIRGALDLLRTGTPPTSYGMTINEWNSYKCNRAAYKLQRVLDVHLTEEQTPPVENGWLPMDIAPKDGRPILAVDYDPDGVSPVVVVRWREINVFLATRDMGRVQGWAILYTESSDEFGEPAWLENPEWWMPLPEAPLMEDENAS